MTQTLRRSNRNNQKHLFYIEQTVVFFFLIFDTYFLSIEHLFRKHFTTKSSYKIIASTISVEWKKNIKHFFSKKNLTNFQVRPKCLLFNCKWLYFNQLLCDIIIIECNKCVIKKQILFYALDGCTTEKKAMKILGVWIQWVKLLMVLFSNAFQAIKNS